MLAKYGYAARPEKTKQPRIRLGDGGIQKVENFVSFLMHPFNIASLLFGTQKLTMDTGEKIEVPSVF